MILLIPLKNLTTADKNGIRNHQFDIIHNIKRLRILLLHKIPSQEFLITNYIIHNIFP